MAAMAGVVWWTPNGRSGRYGDLRKYIQLQMTKIPLPKESYNKRKSLLQERLVINLLLKGGFSAAWAETWSEMPRYKNSLGTLHT